MRMRNVVLMMALALMALPAMAQTGYRPTSATHLCVQPTETKDGTIVFVPAPLNLAAITDPCEEACFDGVFGLGHMRGTKGLHTPEYEQALRDKYGVNPLPIETKLAYCTQDTVLLDQAHALRIAGNYSVPFSPGFWRVGRRGWDLNAWKAFRTQERAIRLAMKGDSEKFLHVLDLQIAMIEAGQATDPALGAWEWHPYKQTWVPKAWTRPGKNLTWIDLAIGNSRSAITVPDGRN